MISVSGNEWIEKKANKNSVDKIKQDFGFSEILSKLIVLRNFDITEINNIHNSLNITNIFKNNKDFNDSADLLINSLNQKDYICILGDYDVDGSTSTSLLVRFFKHINHPYFYYIPDREKDGYGATKKIFQKLILKKPQLVIMVDCGSNSNEAINFLNDNDIKSLIIDHHEINKPYPKSNIIINPKKNNGYQKYNYLCATTLTYFFLEILIKKIKSDFKLSNFLIYVLLATICDVMPLRKINKIIGSYVIKNFKIQDSDALNILFQQIGINKKITINDLGYLIGPIINSGGRLGYSKYATKLLTSNNQETIKDISAQLIQLNNKRKVIEKKILNEIDFEKIKKENKKVIIYYKKNINEGLIGIIAARLKDYFNKPSIVITNSNNILKGSARSTKDYNIGHLMKLLCDKKIIINGGGHNMAAGFSLKKENIRILDNFIQKDCEEKKINFNNYHNYDSEISFSAINNVFLSEINKLGPFGNENFIPIFFIKNARVIKTKILNNKHIFAIIKPDHGPSIKSICFNCMHTVIGEHLLLYKKKINIIAEINENIWNNKKTIQLNVKDLILND
ncbi:single-stranded-DNA-specific exonuclease RecJ [Candidatus Pelagibacter sp.]|jgi:single-stranded-DNA-specific exonuclease|nr:single-stranded-DNA-specific exonuclease RecJ [Candidatus Pelagibacter sp.]